MSRLKKETPPGGLNLEPKKNNDVAFEKKRKSPWRAKLGAKEKSKND